MLISFRSFDVYYCNHHFSSLFDRSGMRLSNRQRVSADDEENSEFGGDGGMKEMQKGERTHFVNKNDMHSELKKRRDLRSFFG